MGSVFKRKYQRWAEPQKTDSRSAPDAKTWTLDPLRNPVSRQILESESAPNPDFSLNLKPKYYLLSLLLSIIEKYIKYYVLSLLFSIIDKCNILVSGSD